MLLVGRRRAGADRLGRIAGGHFDVAARRRTLEFAGRIEGTDVSPALADLVGDGAFLTRWNNEILEPASIDGDYVFEAADADTAYQRVIYQTRNRGDLSGLALLVILGVGGVMIVIALRARRVPAEHRLP